MQTRTVTDAVIAALKGAGLLVGDAERPVGAGWQGAPGQSGFAPYVVVYPLLGGTADGSLDDPYADGWAVYQLTSVGGSRSQTEWTADRARQAILTTPMATPERKVVHVALDALGGVMREDDAPPPIFYSPERYRLVITSA